MISILSPTRKRPNNVTRLVNSIVDTVNDLRNVELLVYIDDDDEESIPALSAAAERINVNAVQGNKLIGSQMYNELAKLAQGDIIMFAADDIVFKTKNWDVVVDVQFNAIEDKILFIYGNDGFQNGRIGTHGFIHRYWMELVGYVLPPKLASSYTDEWVTELAERAGRKLYLPDLIIEHLHPAAGKAPNDETYTKRIEVAGDLAAYYKSLEPERIRDAAKLKEFIKIFAQ
jgi:glycosyltransferase involved in cell wall biosynthesis